MIRKSITFGILALSTVAVATPSFAQGIEIGRDGIRLVQPQSERGYRDGDNLRRSNDRDLPRSAKAVRADISERQAVRIAKGEGLREVDDVRKTRMAYRVDGFDRRGDDIRVEVDRYTGEVLSVR